MSNVVYEPGYKFKSSFRLDKPENYNVDFVELLVKVWLEGDLGQLYVEEGPVQDLTVLLQDLSVRRQGSQLRRSETNSNECNEQ